MKPTPQAAPPSQVDRTDTWRWPIDVAAYDRSPDLTAEELAALTALAPRLYGWHRRREPPWQRIERLLRPLIEARGALDLATPRQVIHAGWAVTALLAQMLARGSSLWAWSESTWIELLGRDQASFLAAHPKMPEPYSVRQPMIAIAYVLRCLVDLRPLGPFAHVALANKVFGRHRVDAAMEPMQRVLAGWGYVRYQGIDVVQGVLSMALLLNGSPRLEDLRAETLEVYGRELPGHRRSALHRIERALTELGITGMPPPRRHGPAPSVDHQVDPRWAEWVLRWEATSTLMPSTRQATRSTLLRMGHWLAAEHSDVFEPAQWTRQLCAAAVAAVDRMNVGDYVAHPEALRERVGEPLSPRAKMSYLAALRIFFHDCAEWGWIPRRFDPRRALSAPRSVRALIGPDPRVIADDVWAKLLWAGLNLTEKDLPSGTRYPIELDCGRGACARRPRHNRSRRMVKGSAFSTFHLTRLDRASRSRLMPSSATPSWRGRPFVLPSLTLSIVSHASVFPCSSASVPHGWGALTSTTA